METEMLIRLWEKKQNMVIYLQCDPLKVYIATWKKLARKTSKCQLVFWVVGRIVSDFTFLL